MYIESRTYIGTEDVLTEFYNEEPDFGKLPGQESAPDDIATRTSNYTPYDLFCFNTKFREKVSTTYPGYYHKLEGVGRGRRTYQAVVLYDGIRVVPITMSMKNVMDKWVTECSTEYKNKCLLFSAKRDIWHNSVCLPAYWIESVLPYTSIPDEFEYKFGTKESTEKVVTNGLVYLKLNKDTVYQNLYNKLRIGIVKELYRLYKAGSIVVDDDEFAKRWDLRYIRGKLYTCLWTHYLVERTKTQFLLDATNDNAYVETEHGIYSPKTLKELCAI